MKALLVHTKTKTKAIESAIKDYVERKSVDDLIALSSKIAIDLDWRKEEELELDECKDHC